MSVLDGEERFGRLILSTEGRKIKMEIDLSLEVFEFEPLEAMAFAATMLRMSLSAVNVPITNDKSGENKWPK